MKKKEQFTLGTRKNVKILLLLFRVVSYKDYFDEKSEMYSIKAFRLLQFIDYCFTVEI